MQLIQMQKFSLETARIGWHVGGVLNETALWFLKGFYLNA